MSLEWNGTLYCILLDASLRVVIFASIVSFILLAVRIRSSSLRHAAWTAVLFAMLLMPVLPYCLPPIPVPDLVPALAVQTDPEIPETNPPLSFRSSSDITPEPILGMQQELSSTTASPERKSVWLFAPMILYFTGVIILLFRLLLGWRAMSQIKRACTPVALKTDIRLQLISGMTQVYESERVVAPLTAGITSPRIILPVAWRKWPSEKLRAVLAHEFAHVRRRDPVIALLSRLNRCVFWFHPLAWWLARKLAATAELACDDEAIRTVGERKLYAEVLLEIARTVRRSDGRLAWQSVGINGNGILNRRIDRLLQGNLLCEISRIRKAIVVLGCTAALFLAAACRQESQPTALQEDPKVMAQKTQRRPSQSFWAKRFRIITDPVNAPFEFGAGTGVQGLDVDIGNEIGNHLGIAVKWVKAPSPGYKQNRLKLVVDEFLGRYPGAILPNDYEHLFELLKKGDAEILISAIAIDPNKSADFEFSKPYYDTGDIIAHQRNRFDITNLASLSGKKVGVVAGRPGDAFMATQKTATAVAITKYSAIDDALGALNIREIDAVVGDEPLITYSSVKSFHNTTTLPTLINKYRYAVVVRKGKTELLAKINATIDRLKSSGELKRLEEVWFGNVRKDAMDLHKKNLEMAKLVDTNSSASAFSK